MEELPFMKDVEGGEDTVVLSKEAFFKLMASMREENVKVLENKMKELEMGILGK